MSEPIVQQIPRDSLVVFTRPEFVAHLQPLLSTGNVMFTRTWSEMRSKLAAPTTRTLIIDPISGAAKNGLPLVELANNFPSVAIVVYAGFDVEGLHAIACLSRCGAPIYEVLVHGPDTVYHRFVQAIVRANANHLVCEAVGPLKIGVGKLPHSVGAALSDLFVRPGRYADVRDLATQSHSTVSTLYRQFEGAHLCPPKRIVTLARICRGYFLLRTTTGSARDVALKIGYQRATTFADNCADIFGWGPSKLRRVEDEHEIALALRDWVCKPPTVKTACERV